MNVNELKQIIKNATTVLVLDNGEPAFVIVDYKTYKDLISKPKSFSEQVFRSSVIPDSRESEIMDRLNKEIQSIKSQIEAEEKRLAEMPQEGAE
jgi:hypothetical protein